MIVIVIVIVTAIVILFSQTLGDMPHPACAFLPRSLSSVTALLSSPQPLTPTASLQAYS